jgi:hypothetical protein
VVKGQDKLEEMYPDEGIPVVWDAIRIGMLETLGSLAKAMGEASLSVLDASMAEQTKKDGIETDYSDTKNRIKNRVEILKNIEKIEIKA